MKARPPDRDDHDRDGRRHDAERARGWPGGEFRSPMALAVIGGLIFSTILSLVFVPAMFMVMDDLGALIWRFGKRLIVHSEDADVAGHHEAAPADATPNTEEHRAPCGGVDSLWLGSSERTAKVVAAEVKFLSATAYPTRSAQLPSAWSCSSKMRPRVRSRIASLRQA